MNKIMNILIQTKRNKMIKVKSSNKRINKQKLIFFSKLKASKYIKILKRTKLAII